MSLINEALKRAKQAQQRQPALATVDAPLEPAVPTSPGQGPVPWTVGAIALLVVLVGAWCISVWWRTPSPVALVPGANKLAAHAPKAPTAPPSASSAALAAARSAPAPVKAAATTGPAPSVGSTKLSPALASRELGSHSSVTNPVAQKPSLAASDKPAAATLVSAPTTEKVASGAVASTDKASTDKASTDKASTDKASSLRPPEFDHVESTPSADQGISLVQRTLPEAAPDPTFMSSFRLQGIFYRPVKATAMVNGMVLFLGDEVNGARLVSVESQSIGLLWHGRTNVLYLK